MLKIARPRGSEVLVEMAAAALNHRDLYLRHGLYPQPRFDIALCCDGVGQVVDIGPEASAVWLKCRVCINPGSGWLTDPDSPESPEGYLTRGASAGGMGTLQQYILVDQDDVVAAPEHLNDAEGAALPAAGLTAWRALMARSQNAFRDRNILVPGIGGGVALFVMQLALAVGCRVYVTSSSEEKLSRARALGATGGVLYTRRDWETELLALLPSTRKRIDAIIDGAGGDIVKSGVRVLKHNGVIVSYGMTIGPTVPFPMKAVLRNIQLVGTTMGSRKDFHDMVGFVGMKKIRPVISHVVRGIDEMNEVENLFRIMAQGTQFGKLVVQLRDPGTRLWLDGCRL